MSAEILTNILLSCKLQKLTLRVLGQDGALFRYAFLHLVNNLFDSTKIKRVLFSLLLTDM